MGRYELVRPLGRGRFGALYEAKDLELGRRVALRVLGAAHLRLLSRSGPEVRRTAEALARLAHSGLVVLHDVGWDGARLWAALELLTGETLARRLNRGPLPLAEALQVTRDAAQALAHARWRGLFHGALRPAELFLCEGGQVKVLDAGWGQLLVGAARAPPPACRAPELDRGEEASERTDVWGLGAILVLAVAGRPLAAAEQEPLSRERAWAMVPSLPPRTREVLRCCFDPDGASRPEVGELGVALDRALDEVRRPRGRVRAALRRALVAFRGRPAGGP
jgi:serine/threonine protein kinase